MLYKIDRLTRSLTNFSKIVEVLDNAKASFVSLTQSFSTTTSMGRLTFDPTGLAETFELDAIDNLDPEVLKLSVPAVRVRGGHQLNLVVPGPGQAELPVQRDPKLIALVAEAIQARELELANPELSMNALAKREGRCRTRMAKLAGLSCIAPDIVSRIVEGRQPVGADVAESAGQAIADAVG